VEGKGDDTVVGEPGFVIPMEEFNIDILIERTRQAIPGTWENTPAATALGRERNCGVLGGIAKSKNGKRFKRPIEDDSTRRYSPTGHVGHAERICH
jgi:hypothetical protein